MARKTLNRKVLRDEATAADALEKVAGEGAVEGAKKTRKKKEKDPNKPVVKRKSRSKTPEVIRKKAFWGVFNQSGKRVASYEFSQKKSAENKAAELSANGKPLHYITKYKDDIAS